MREDLNTVARRSTRGSSTPRERFLPRASSNNSSNMEEGARDERRSQHRGPITMVMAPFLEPEDNPEQTTWPTSSQQFSYFYPEWLGLS
jgi:hypothetical protein